MPRIHKGIGDDLAVAVISVAINGSIIQQRQIVVRLFLSVAGAIFYPHQLRFLIRLLAHGDGLRHAPAAQGDGALPGFRPLVGRDVEAEVLLHQAAGAGGLGNPSHVGGGVQFHLVRGEQEGVLLLLADGEGGALAGAGQDDGGVALVVGLVGLGGDGQ